MSYQIEYKTTTVNDLELLYRVFGGNDATQKMVILHGWNTVGSESWEPFILLFQDLVNTDSLQIIAPDMPGFARSKKPNSIWQAEDYAHHLSDFIRSQNIDNVILVGHSFGGAISSLIASLHPEVSLKHLYIVAPAIVRNWGKSESKRQHITKIGKKIFSFAPLQPLFKITRKVWYKLLGSPDYTKTNGIMTQIMSRVVTHDVQYCLKDITVPTTIIWGTEDKMTPFSQAEIIHNQIHNSELTVFEGVNHGVHINATQKLFKTIAQRL
jgi:pimeloyl-ACP methyl ester carboxylesterase